MSETYNPEQARQAAQKVHIENWFKSAYRDVMQISAKDAVQLWSEVDIGEDSWLQVFLRFRGDMGWLDKHGKLPWGSGPFWEG